MSIDHNFIENVSILELSLLINNGIFDLCLQDISETLSCCIEKLEKQPNKYSTIFNILSQHLLDDDQYLHTYYGKRKEDCGFYMNHLRRIFIDLFGDYNIYSPLIHLIKKGINNILMYLLRDGLLTDCIYSKIIEIQYHYKKGILYNHIEQEAKSFFQYQIDTW